jgi:hypothetical protein
MGYEYKIRCDGCNTLIQDGVTQIRNYAKCEMVEDVEIDNATGDIKTPSYCSWVFCRQCIEKIIRKPGL